MIRLKLDAHSLGMKSKEERCCHGSHPPEKYNRGLALNPPPHGQPFKETETMTYTAPIKDMLFNMEHLAQIEQVAQLPGFEDAGLETAQAVLEECAKLCPKRLSPAECGR